MTRRDVKNLDARKRRIAEIASAIVAGMIEKREIECTEEDIKRAMPQAIADAKAAYDAAEEFVS
jgi:hypothetical protein